MRERHGCLSLLGRPMWLAAVSRVGWRAGVGALMSACEARPGVSRPIQGDDGFSRTGRVAYSPETYFGALPENVVALRDYGWRHPPGLVLRPGPRNTGLLAPLTWELTGRPACGFWRGVEPWAEWCIPAVMDRWRRWRPRGPAGRAGARRAGVTALAVLAVTAALAVLLAVLSHLAWPPVVVAIVGTVPALYLAWLAVPGVISPPEPAAKGRPMAAWRGGGIRWSWACTR